MNRILVPIAGTVALVGASLPVSAALAAAAPPPLTVKVSPASVTAGSTGNAFTFKVKAGRSVAGKLSLTIPAGWTVPQATNPHSPGYVAVHKLTCASAVRSGAITGSRIVVKFSCAAARDFSLTYGGTAASSKVTAVTLAGPAKFTTKVKIGSAPYRALAVQPVVTVKPGPLAKLVVSADSGTTVQAPNHFLTNFMDVFETQTGQLPASAQFSAAGFDTFNNPLGDETAAATWSVTPSDGGSCSFSAPHEFCTVGAQGAHDVGAQIGSVTGSSSITGAYFAPGYTCEGDHYDVNGSIADGCETPQPLSAHTQNTASSVGSLSCFDSSSLEILGVLPSDARTHINPTVTGFDAMVGAAPEWYSVTATGGICPNDVAATIAVTNSTHLDCYKVTVTTDSGSESVQTDSSGNATISDSSLTYMDMSTVYFEIQKTCSPASATVDDAHFKIDFTL